MDGGAAIFTTSKNTAAVFLAKSVKKGGCFCQFQYQVYNWQYFILHWQNGCIYLCYNCLACSLRFKKASLLMEIIISVIFFAKQFGAIIENCYFFCMDEGSIG